MGALFAKLTSGLTNTGVQSPDGTTTFQPNSAATGKALAAASAATAQPGTSSINGPNGGAPQIPLPTITTTQQDGPMGDGSGPILPRPDITTVDPGQDRNVVTQNAPIVGAQPKLVHPTYAQALSSGNPSEVSTKGTVLHLLMEAGLGALAGDAAARTRDASGRYPGASAGFVAGMNLPFQQQERANALAQQQAAIAHTRAETAAIPGMSAADLALKQAQTGYFGARTDVTGNKKVGDQIIGPDGKVIYSGLTPAQISANAAAAASGKATGKATAITNAGGTPEQVLTALGVKDHSQPNTSVAQMYLDRNNGDPDAAIKQMQADKISFHNSTPAAAARKNGGSMKDFGPAPAGRPEGSTGTLSGGTKVVVRGGRLVAQ